ncbi:MAG: amidohydrolase family protein [Candidatus Thermoplasmatota archaeon]|jgi:5-methylthioadenosine/S-adenosylhomocysteine deaminase|nr:amidohydrolase family protein [Candidatus Thermoplasmatota archaeon]
MQILLKNGIVITNTGPPSRMDVFLDDGLISEVSETISHESEYTIDCDGKIVSPGFVNMHTHVSMTNMRTLMDDLEFDKFLARGFKLDEVRTEEEIYWGAKLGILEMLSNGVTSFMDMYYSQEQTARAVEETGIRGFLGWSIVNKNITTQKGDPLSNAENFIKSYRGHKLVTPLPAPHGIYSCDRDDIIASKDMADRYESPYTIHLSENRKEVYDIVKKEKKRPVEYLNDLGFLSNRLVASHLIYVTLAEMRKLGEYRVTGVNDPVSNMKLGNGNFSPVIEMIENGLNFTLGTDSAATENSLDMLENAKIASLLQKNYREESMALDPPMMVRALTLNPWKVFGGNGGMIKEGFKADITVVGGGLSQVPLTPDNAENILIYSTNGRSVSHTIVDGRLIYSNGKFEGINVEEVIRKNSEIYQRYRSLINS